MVRVHPPREGFSIFQARQSLQLVHQSLGLTPSRIRAVHNTPLGKCDAEEGTLLLKVAKVFVDKSAPVRITRSKVTSVKTRTDVYGSPNRDSKVGTPDDANDSAWNGRNQPLSVAIGELCDRLRIRHRFDPLAVWTGCILHQSALISSLVWSVEALRPPQPPFAQESPQLIHSAILSVSVECHCRCQEKDLVEKGKENASGGVGAELNNARKDRSRPHTESQHVSERSEKDGHASLSHRVCYPVFNRVSCR
mmetsp:Transcript_5861/g.13494  ORF Transcript_5861/g.13494 Transcript_5861/m.13494 type:complete len:251 (-) Transcript_5861:1185-1937(-)